uniref:Truncated D-alanine:D-alanine ligase n=1 Tax=Enterococcus faecium TaxID=1352 RepID=Q9XCR2_ENTFC|nr:truncated D-alanine:D-alanine ligase [Enterococcus faecium]
MKITLLYGGRSAEQSMKCPFFPHFQF